MKGKNFNNKASTDTNTAKIFDENFADMFEKSLVNEEKEDSIIKGTIVSIDRDFVYVDVGLKSEGKIPIREFASDDAGILTIGNKIDVYLEKREGRGGRTILSRDKAVREHAWDEYKGMFENKQNVTGKIVGRVKGGFAVYLLKGIIAFLPGSQVDVRNVRDASALADVEQPFRILKMDETQGNIVVSRKAILEESRAGDLDKALSEIKEGMIIEATVKNITDYGAFLDCEMFDGLLHITDISWNKVAHPAEVLSVGQKLKVMITKYNPDTKRVSLGLKQLEKNPWEGLVDKYKPGSKFKGVVTNVADYGAFVQLEPGVEGLVYQTEIAYNIKNSHPRKLLKTGDEIEVMVLEIDIDKQRISLSMKRCQENPWELFAQKYAVGSTIEGVVTNIADFGVFVEVASDAPKFTIEGLVPATEVSWSNNPEVSMRELKPGDKIKVLVMSIDLERERVALSIRQLSEDYLTKAAREFGENGVITAMVTAVRKDGIEVELKEGISAFVRKSELSKHKSDQLPTRFAEGERVDVKIVSFDNNTRRFNVSIRALELEQERHAIEKYGSTTSGASLGDILGEALNADSDGKEGK